MSLGHKFCIYHILVDNCIFDRIIDNYVIYDGANPSNHNVLYLSIKNFRDMLYAKSDCIDRSTKHACSCERASFDDITSYKANIDSSHLFMIMMLFIVLISTVIMMYTELRSTRCVA